MQKENKRCISKEGIPHAHKACQKKMMMKRKDAYPKKIYRREKSCKGVPPPSTKKNISTHLHILIKVYDLFLLWIRSLTSHNMRSRYAFKSSTPTAPQNKAIRDRVGKKGTIKSLGKELYTLSDSRDHLRNFINFI